MVRKKKEVKMERKKWFKKEEEYLLKYYQRKTNQELAKHFNVTSKSIETKLHRIGVRRKKVKEKLRPVKPEHKIKPPMDEKRRQAIAIFDSAIRLYYKGSNKEALKEFKKIVENYSSVIDVARRAKEFLH